MLIFLLLLVSMEYEHYLCYSTLYILWLCHAPCQIHKLFTTKGESEPPFLYFYLDILSILSLDYVKRKLN